MSADFSDTICITLDVDWAVEEVLGQVVEKLQRAGVSATFFATGPSEGLSAAQGDQIEVGLHPNFNDCKGDFEAPLELVGRAFPDAKGARSHSLFVSSHILELYIRHGLTYEANIFLLEHEGLRPALRFAELVSIPFNWSDDKHFELERGFTSDGVGLDRPGLKVLNFHPIHVAMNTRDLAHYAEYKPHQREFSALEPFVNRDRPGVATLFDQVLAEISDRGLRTARMCDVASEFRATLGNEAGA